MLGKPSDLDYPSECLAGLMEENANEYVGGEWDKLCRIAVLESLYPLSVYRKIGSIMVNYLPCSSLYVQ